MFDPIDSAVKDIKGNLEFLDKLFSWPMLVIGTVGVVGILTLIVFVLH